MEILVCLRSCGNLLGLFGMATGCTIITSVSKWPQAVVKVGLAVVLAKKFGLVGLVTASCVAATFQIVFVGVFILKERFVDTTLILRGALFVTVATILALVAWRLPLKTGIAYLSVGAFITMALWALVWLLFAWRTELRSTLISAVVSLTNRLGIHGYS